MINRKLKIKMVEAENKCRRLAKNIVNSTKFDYFIIGTITFNTIVYALHYYK